MRRNSAIAWLARHKLTAVAVSVLVAFVAISLAL
jgi:hypothetical protein